MLENEVRSVDITSLDRICIDSIELVKFARESAMKQVNVIQTMTYYCIGKWIVEEQQKGEKRAKYGKQILKQLSETLNAEFGRGFSVDTLENMRKFYLVYQDRISENLYRNFAVEKSEKASRILDDEKPFALSWSHYVKLMRIEDESARKFYVMKRMMHWLS